MLENAEGRVRASVETVRRCLRRENLVWRRPRPVLGPRDPRRARKLRKVRGLLRALPADGAAGGVPGRGRPEPQPPDVGCMWMARGEQAPVVTPGTNVKRYLSGSMSWRTGELVVTRGTRRDAALFVRHPEDLRRRFRHCRRVHVICGNARFHTAGGSRLVRQYLAAHGDRVVLHYPSFRSMPTNSASRHALR